MFGQSVTSVVLGILLASSAGDVRIADAAMERDHGAVQSLLKQKADVNAAQGDGTTALHWSAYHDDLEMMQWLIQAGADLSATTRLGAMTPLAIAATNGNAATVQLLLKEGADPNAANSNGTSPLMMAAAAGKPEAIELLLDAGADPNARDLTNGQTTVMFAAALNRSEAIRLLAGRGADVDVLSAVSEAGANESSHSAERAKNVATVGGNAALHFAAREGLLEAVKALLEAGAEVNQISSASDGMTPLVQAIINGRLDVAEVLLKHGADPNIASTASGVTALWAVLDARYAPRAWYPSPSVAEEETSHLDLLKELLAHGANVNARLIRKPWFRTFGDSRQPNPAGATAFYRAAQANDVPALKTLLDAGANPTIPTTGGTEPIVVAAGLDQDFQGANFVPESRLETIRLLVEEAGADVNASDLRGYSVLHAAAYLGRSDIIEYLVTQGADVSRRANQISGGSSAQTTEPGQGDTVADMANGWVEKTLQFPETVNLLIDLGSDFSNTCWASVCVNPRTDKKPANR